jgi:hypothetical protein
MKNNSSKLKHLKLNSETIPKSIKVSEKSKSSEKVLRDSLLRLSGLKPLGRSDDWPSLSHSHELMPFDGMRYWHQHYCQISSNKFEQRSLLSINYNKHICHMCGEIKGSRRVR